MMSGVSVKWLDPNRETEGAVLGERAKNKSHFACLFLSTATETARMLTVPEMGLQGLYISKPLLPLPVTPTLASK